MYKIYKNNCETEDEKANLHLVSDNIIDQKSGHIHIVSLLSKLLIKSDFDV